MDTKDGARKHGRLDDDAMMQGCFRAPKNVNRNVNKKWISD